jgi:hypothetical protein
MENGEDDDLTLLCEHCDEPLREHPCPRDVAKLLDAKFVPLEEEIEKREKQKMKICVLCGKEFTEYGNNPWPLAEPELGQCCNKCDDYKVTPARIKQRGEYCDAHAVGDLLQNVREVANSLRQKEKQQQQKGGKNDGGDDNNTKTHRSGSD